MIGKEDTLEECRNYGFGMKAKWYEHERQAVCENEEYKILWDFSIQSNNVIETRRLDMIIVEKKNNKCQNIDFAAHTIPGLMKKKKRKY